ncbi:HD domain-containing protein [Oceaniglobus trochenteri]|uniref:HD domain-containing protein n=1 Tax=Oceaniglobus trochenteri TaxID=2763260 RepID=UPI001CFFC667|nr:HD domain-containing protein [Oceaniglobus trochenteri]
MNDRIKQAEALARRLHEGQLRKGAAREPYIVHLEEVAALVTDWGGDTDTIAAAWLHDTVEDCAPFNRADLTREMGERIAAIVAELTDDKSLPKPERKQAQLENAPHKSPEAALVKLADKTSNIGALVVSPPESWPRARLIAYVDWGVAVVNALPQPLSEQALAEFRRRVTMARLAFG